MIRRIEGDEYKFEITKGKKTIIWYLDQAKKIHFNISYAKDVALFEVTEEDGPFYQAIRDLNDSFQFLTAFGKMKKTESGFYIPTDENITGTLHGVYLAKKNESYELLFDDFASGQPGFSEVIITKQSTVIYPCVALAFEHFRNKQEMAFSYCKKLPTSFCKKRT